MRGELLVCAGCLRHEAEGIRLPVNVIENNQVRFEAWYAAEAAAKHVPGSHSTGPEDLETSPLGEDTDAIDPLAASRQSKAVVAGTSAVHGTPVPARKILPVRGVKLPKRRPPLATLAVADEMAGQGAPVGALGQPQRSPYLIAAIILLAVLTPAFAVSLWLAIGAQVGREELMAEVERSRQEAKASRDEQLRSLYELHLRSLEAERARASGGRPADHPSGGGGDSQPQEQPAAVVPKAAPVGLSASTREALEAQEVQLAERIRPGLRAETRGERMVAMAEAIRWRAVGCIPDIRPMLKSQDLAERMLAADALGKLGDKESLVLLRSLAAVDPEPEGRVAARTAIAWITGEYTQLDLGRLSTPELDQLRRTITGDPTHEDALRLVEAELRRRGSGNE